MRNPWILALMALPDVVLLIVGTIATALVSPFIGIIPPLARAIGHDLKAQTAVVNDWTRRIREAAKS